MYCGTYIKYHFEHRLHKDCLYSSDRLEITVACMRVRELHCKRITNEYPSLVPISLPCHDWYWSGLRLLCSVVEDHLCLSIPVLTAFIVTGKGGEYLNRSGFIHKDGNRKRYDCFLVLHRDLLFMSGCQT